MIALVSLESGETIVLSKDENTLGRDESNDVVLKVGNLI